MNLNTLLKSMPVHQPLLYVGSLIGSNNKFTLFTKESDPVKMEWRQRFRPPKYKIVSAANNSFVYFPTL